MSGCSLFGPHQPVRPAEPVFALVDPAEPDSVRAMDGPIAVAVPQNGAGSFCLRLTPPPTGPMPVLKLPPSIKGVALAVDQVLSAPVDRATPGWVIEAGPAARPPVVPRVLVSLASRDGVVDLKLAHRPDSPTEVFAESPGRPILLWVDVTTTATTPSGMAKFDLAAVGSDGIVLATVAVELTVDDFEMPATPTLAVAADVPWGSLQAAFPSACNGLTPRLIERGDPKTAAAVDVFDRIVTAAHDNRVAAYVSALGPIVKWPVDSGPACDWTRFDSVAGPWLDGSTFADKTPAGLWPLPGTEALRSYDRSAQTLYWTTAAAHFDDRRWLPRSPVVPSSDPASPSAAASEAADARNLLAVRPALSVVAGSGADLAALPAGLGAGDRSRLSLRAPGPVEIAAAPGATGPASPAWVDAPAQMVTEQQVRSIAWLAFMRGATLVRWHDPLVADPVDPDAPTTAWFYPGKTFGVNGPVETVQLRWVRQAEQDYEYLVRSRQRGRVELTGRLCGLVVRPIAVDARQAAGLEVSLLAGTAEAGTCERARRALVAANGPATDAARPPPPEVDRWIASHDRPAVLPVAVRWSWAAVDPLDPGSAAGRAVTAEVVADVYRPGDESVVDDRVSIRAEADGWRASPVPAAVPRSAAGRMRVVSAAGRFDLNRARPDQSPVATMVYTDGFTGAEVPCKLALPVAVTERRRQPVSIDGSLADWTDEDAVNLDRPLTRMVTRTSAQSGAAAAADVPASIYTGWSDEQLFVAFKLAGVTPTAGGSARNFASYVAGRAWGEDLCEVTVQPVYSDGTTGPAVHVVCKPGAAVSAEREAADAWEPIDPGVRTASTVDATAGVWRGELAIPWRSIVPPGRGRPSLLRFNFTQHRQQTGESASWAGPLFESRQPRFSGLLVVRDTAGEP